MALLTLDQRKAIFKYLGFGEYNESSIKAFQKRYMLRKSDADGIWGVNTDNTARTVYYTKTYTKNFKPEEFRCECGGRYCCGYPNYMKPSELIHIQKIRDHYGKPITITSGLRCRTWNSKCGGSIQNSLHMQGLALDFYQQGVTDTLANRKKAIKWIKAQADHHYSYGNGINSYGGRVSAPYMGNCLHTDCYDRVEPKYPKWVEPYYKVIDVSDWQGSINWKKVKADGVVGAVIRYADGDVLDSRFDENMRNAKAAGLHIGSYIFSRAKTKAEAEKEAIRLYKATKKYAPDMPLFIDLEARGLEKYADTVAIAFLTKIKALGGKAGVYANLTWWNHYLKKTATEYNSNSFWIAQYNSTMDYKPASRMGMWQYSSSGSVDGIKGRVDMNKLYVAYWKAKPKTNAEKLADCARAFAYSTNTKNANYGTGKPKKAYIDALDKYYPGQRQHWSHGGASCDTFQGTCVRASGNGSDCPRGLSISYLVKSPHFTEVHPKSVKELQNGDIIIRFNEKTQKGHTCIFCDGKIKEASCRDFWPKTTDTAKARLSAAGARVFRAK